MRRPVAELGRVIVGLHAEFLNAIHVGADHKGVVVEVMIERAVHQKHIRGFATAIHIHRGIERASERLLPAASGSRRCPRSQQRQIQELSSVQGKITDLPLHHYRADRAAARLYQRIFAND